jgi:sterol 14alpha-demethylase
MTQLPPTVSGARFLVGHALEFSRDRTAITQRGYREHGDVFRMRLGPISVAVVSGAEHNAHFYRETDKSLSMAEVYAFLRASFGEVLFIAGPETYRNQRPLLQQTFSRERMPLYVKAMHAEVSRWLEALGDEGRFDISAEMRPLTQQIIGHALFGPNFRDELTAEFWEQYELLSAAITVLLPAWVPIKRFRDRNKARRRIRAMLDPLIERRRAAPQQYADVVTHLLHTPQADGTLMNHDQIIAFFMGLLFAAHETTAGQAAWTVIQLLQNPAYLATVRAEVDGVLQNGAPDRAEVLKSLRHVFLAVEETSRMHSSGDVQFRLVKQDVQFGRFVIPRRWLVMVGAGASHFLESEFQDPASYDPLRFSAERNEGQSNAIVTFGGGVHKCAGMNFATNEMAIIAAMLVHRFDLELQSDDIRTINNQGGSHPSEAWIGYRKRPS